MPLHRSDAYGREHAALKATTNDALGPVARDSLAAVVDQFRKLVRKADVGIIDVAWARKQAESNKVNQLVQNQQTQVQELEDAFSDDPGRPAKIAGTNPERARGGVDRETVAAAKLQAPESLRVEGRSGAREGFGINAERGPGVARRARDRPEVPRVLGGQVRGAQLRRAQVRDVTPGAAQGQRRKAMEGPGQRRPAINRH